MNTSKNANTVDSAIGDAAGVPYRFWAFISYSRKDNGVVRASATTGIPWADWLQDALETYVIPEGLVGTRNIHGEIIPPRLQRVFRDEEDMGASGSLSESIRCGLEESRCLVVICSPRSAASPWVDKEVRHFKHSGRAARILPFIIAGEPGASIGDKVKIDAVEECFVPALLHPLGPDGEVDRSIPESNVPLGADIRWGDSKREIKANELKEAETAMNHAKLVLLSGILGVHLDDLINRGRVRQAEENKRKTARARKLAVGFGTLTAIAMIGAAAAWVKGEHAIKQERLAKAEASRSEYLRGSSLASTEEEDEALLLLARAVEMNPENREAVTRLVALLAQKRWPYRCATLRHAFPVSHLKASQDGRRLFSANDLGDSMNSLKAIHVWQIPSFKLGTITPLEAGKGHLQVEVDPKGERVLLKEVRYHGSENSSLIDASDGMTIAGYHSSQSCQTKVAFSTDGTMALEWSFDGNLKISSADTGKEIAFIFVQEAPKLRSPGTPETSSYNEADGDDALVDGDHEINSFPGFFSGKILAEVEMEDILATNLAPGGNEPLDKDTADEASGNDDRSSDYSYGSHILYADVREKKALVVTADGTFSRIPLDNPLAIQRVQLDMNVGGRRAQDVSLEWATVDPEELWFYGMVAGKPVQWDSTGQIAANGWGSEDLVNPDDVTFEGRFFDDGQLSLVRTSDNQTVAEIVPRFIPTAASDQGDSTCLASNACWKLPSGPASFVAPNEIMTADGPKGYLFGPGANRSGPVRHNEAISAVCRLGPDLVASGSHGGEVKIWRFSKYMLDPELKELERMEKPAFDPQEGQYPDALELVKKSADANVELWSSVDADTGAGARSVILRNLRSGNTQQMDFELDPLIQVISMNLSPDGRLGLFTSYRSFGPRSADEGTRVFDAANIKDASPLLEHQGIVSAIFSADSSKVVSAGGGQIIFWDTTDHLVTGLTFPHPDVMGLWAHPDGKLLISWSSEGNCVLWDIEAGRKRLSMDRNPAWQLDFKGEIPDLVIGGSVPVDMTRDTLRAVVSYGRSFVLWDTKEGVPLGDPVTCPGPIDTIRFSNATGTAVEVTLLDGRRFSFQGCDLPSPLPQEDVAALTTLARSVSSGEWKDLHNLQPASEQLKKLVKHFASEASANASAAYREGGSLRVSNDGLVEFHLKAAPMLGDLGEAGKIVSGLKWIPRLDPVRGQARVDLVRRDWEREIIRATEDRIAGKSWQWPAMDEDDLDEISFIQTLVDATAGWNKNDGAALAAYCYWYELADENGGEPGDEQMGKVLQQRQQERKLLRERADELTIAALNVSPDDPELLWRRAFTLLLLNRIEEASAVLKKGIANDGIIGARCTETAAAIAMSKGLEDEAMQLLDQSIAKNPPASQAKIRKSIMLLHRKRGSEAIALALEVPQRELRRADARPLGDALWMNGNKERAIVCWKIHSGDSEAHARIAAALWLEGKREEAMAIANKIFFDGDIEKLPENLRDAWRASCGELDEETLPESE